MICICGNEDFCKLELSNEIYIRSAMPVTTKYGTVDKVQQVDMYACKQCGTVKIEV